MQHAPLAALACLALAACSAPAPRHHDGGVADAGPADAGPCAQAASLYGIAVDEQEQALTEGSTLPITLGFQGFQYVRVGIRSDLPLPERVDLWVQATIEGELDRTTPFFGTETRAVDGGAEESLEVTLMFNDLPLADLLGREASLRIWTSSPGCVLTGEARVVLVQGAYQGPDGGLSYGDAG